MATEVPALAPGQLQAQQLRAAGFSDSDISSWAQEKRQTLGEAGFGEPEINAWLGQPDYDFSTMQKQFSTNLAASPKPVTDLTGAIEAGWQQSVSGLLTRGKAPDIAISPQASMLPRLAGAGAGLLGDLPVMVAGFMGGTPAGIETGPGAPIVGAATAYALPQLLRSTLMDAYTKGSFTSFADFWPRAAHILADTAKAYIVGGATGGAGVATKAALPEVSAGVSKLAQTAAEAATMTTVGKALEGQVPTAQDFLDAAVMVGGLHFAGAGAAKLRGLYAGTGIKPNAVLDDAQQDVTIAQDLSSVATNTPPAYADAAANATIDTRGQGKFYHGSSTPLTDLYDYYGSNLNYYGSGFYTTDALDVAKGYSRKGGGKEPSIYAVKPGGQENLFDMEKPLDPQFKEQLTRLGESDDLVGLAMQENPTNLREVYNEIRNASASLDVPAYEVQETFDLLNERLMNEGYTGLQHTGGLLTGKEPHTVQIHWAPSTTGLGIERLAPTEEAAIGAPPAPPSPPTTPSLPANDPRKAILDHISIGEGSAGRPLTFSRLYSAAVDRLFPLSKAESKATEGAELPAPDSPYKLARLMAGSAGRADAMLTGGGTFDFNTYQNNGASLQSVLEPVKDDLNGFRTYAASRRALELESRGIKTGFDLGAAQTIVDQDGAKYEQNLQNLIGFQNRVSAYLRDSGVLSPEAYDAMLEANKLYVPFQRLIEPPQVPSMRESLQPRQPIRAIEGSERTVIDPIESIIRNTYLFTQMAERNSVGTKLVDLLASEAPEASTPAPTEATTDVLKDAGVADPDAIAPMVEAARSPTREGEIRIFRNGKPETYRVDPEIANAIKGLDQQSMGMIERMLAPLSRTLRAGAVLQPDFILRHTLRDLLYAHVTFAGGMFNPMDMVRGIVGLARKDEDFENWRKAGGANISMVSLDRRYLQQSIDQLTDTGLLERSWNVIGNPDEWIGDRAKAAVTLPFKAASKYLISPLQVGVQFAESASHLGAFKKSLRQMGVEEGEQPTKEQIQQAGFVSRDTAVDASRMGSAMRSFNAISAFANITVQDTDRVIRAFANSPMSTAIKVAGAISLPSALVWLNGHNDSRYKDAPDWEKDLFWVIPTDRWEDISPNDIDDLPADLVRTLPDGRTQMNNGITWRIPKPWGMGVVFGSGVERTLSAFADHAPDAYTGLASSLGQITIPNLLPNAIAPTVEQFANRSIFTNRTLIPSPQESYLPEYQYTPYTSELAKALGQTIGAFPGIREAKLEPGMFGSVARALSSPILIENYMRDWSGNLGVYALEAADAGLRKAGVVPDPPRPNDTLADIPFVKAFVVRYPEAGSQPMQDFYDAFNRNQTYYNTWIGLARTGDADAADKVQQAGGPAMMVQLTGIRDTLAEHAKLIRDVYANPEMQSDEKRQLIDTLYWRMTELARSGRDLMRGLSTIQPEAENAQ